MPKEATISFKSNPSVSITREFRFEAAHHLADYDGPCARVHGHSYRVQATVRGSVLEDEGMVLDFKDLDRAIRDCCGMYDHADLNGFFRQPTAENIALDIFSKLRDILSLRFTHEVTLTRVKLWETADSFVEVEE